MLDLRLQLALFFEHSIAFLIMLQESASSQICTHGSVHKRCHKDPQYLLAGTAYAWLYVSVQYWIRAIALCPHVDGHMHVQVVVEASSKLNSAIVQQY